MQVRVLTGVPGAGKTRKLMQEMVQQKGRYLFSIPRIDLIQERIADLRTMAGLAGSAPMIQAVHGSSRGKGTVARKITEALERLSNLDHVILLVTHEGMMGADLSSFQGWHACLDEAPNAVLSGNFDASATAIYLAKVYGLERSDATSSQYSRLTLRKDAPSVGAIMRDDHLNALVNLARRVRSGKDVYVKITDWADITGRGSLKWWSVWSPLELEAFSSVTIAGSGYFSSIGYMVAKRWHGDRIQFWEEQIDIPGRRLPRVSIRYFTKHYGSTKFWETDEGKDCKAEVCRYLEQIDDLGYWSANEKMRSHFSRRLKGAEVSPRQEGTNSLRSHTSCAFIYSSKPVKADKPFMDEFRITEAEVRRARETEDIIQFVFRGRLRCPDFDGEYTVYLYEEQQAKRLAAYLKQHALAHVEISPIPEAGILDITPAKPGRPRLEVDEASQVKITEERRKRNRETQRRSRERKRAKSIEQGQPPRSRGRPKKTASPLQAAA